MDRLPKYIQGAVESAQQAIAGRLEVLQEESEEVVTNEPQLPKSIRENCPVCNPRIGAREVMEYIGRFMEAPLVLDDGTQEIEYEYLYKCSKCGALVWVSEQWAKENGIQPEARA